MKNVTQAQPLTIEQTISRAKKASKQGKAAVAIELYNTVLKIQPNHPVAKKGLRKLQKGLAPDQFLRAAPANPSQDQINSLVNLYQSGQMIKTEKACRDLLQAYPQSLTVFNILGSALQGQDKLLESVKCYDRAIKFNPDDSDLHFNRGIVLQELGQLDKATESYERSIQLNKDDVEAYHNRGITLKLLGRLDEAIQYMKIAVEKDPGNAQVSDSLVDLLNFYNPKLGTRSPYVKIQEQLQQVGAENTSAFKITDKIVRHLYQQCDHVLASHNLDISTNKSQLFRGTMIGRGCKRHMVVFNRFNSIPKYCFSCYKVTIEPRTVLELFKLYLIFDRLELPNDNARKCMVEVRPEISGTYKGFIYCRSLSEANEILNTVQPLVEKTVSKDIPIFVKRGCSEFTNAYPEYGHITDNGPQLMEYKKEWRKDEKYVDNNLIWYTDSNPNNFSYNHPGFSLLDALVMRNWLVYAATIGDISHQEVSGSHNLFTTDGLKKLMNKRPLFQAVSTGI